MAQRLTFYPIAPNYDYEYAATYFTSQPNARFNQIFVVNLQQGVRYDMISESLLDPIYFRVTDMVGNVLAADTSFLGSYGQDYILDFFPPVTGDYLVNASWDQGTAVREVALGIFADIDSANIPTPYGTINRVDGVPAFDRSFYIAEYADVRNAPVDPLLHYMNTGWSEGRDPNAWFDTDAYLAANADVRAAGVNPLIHYVSNGWREGRDPGPNFDVQRYLDANPDVRDAGIEPLGHWIDFGRATGQPAPVASVGPNVVGGFDAQTYLMMNRDVAVAGIDPRAHYFSNGAREGRDPNRWLDSDGYLAQNPDVRAAGVNPLTHYMASGWREGRDPSTAFNTTAYLDAYRDVRSANVNPLQHFLQAGHAEGRNPFGDGNWL